LEELIRKENEEREIAKKEEKPLFDESMLEAENDSGAADEAEAAAPLTEETLFSEPVDEDSAEEDVTESESEDKNDTPADEQPEEK